MAPSIWQILIVVLIVMLLFGAGKLPRMMEDVAKGIKSFKKGLNDEEDEPQVLAKTKAPTKASSKKAPSKKTPPKKKDK